MATGLDTQMGYAVETTAGTFETVTKFFEVVPPLGIRKIQNYISPRGIRAGRKFPVLDTLGSSRVEGPVTHELVAETIGALLRATIEGTPATSGSNPYTHTFDHSTEIASLSGQWALPSTSANHPMSAAGLRARQWTIQVRPDEIPTLTIDWIGRSVDTDGTPSLASASYASFTRFDFVDASISVGGSEVCVDEITLTGTTGWDMEHKICSTDAGVPSLFRAGKASVTGSFRTDFASLTQLNRYHAGTAAAVVVAFNAGASAQLTYTLNAQFTGEMPIVESEGKTKETVNFKAVHATADASACTAVLINTDSTA